MARVEFDFSTNNIPKGFSLVTREGKTYLRRSGGASKERIMNDPALERVKQNAIEFTEISKMAKIIFDLTSTFTKGIRDSRAYFRLVSQINKVKKKDCGLESTQKTVLANLATTQGQGIMEGFEFNDKIPLFEYFYPHVTINSMVNTIIMSQISIHYRLSNYAGVDLCFIAWERVCINKQNGRGIIDHSNEHAISRSKQMQPMEFVFETSPPEDSIQFYLCKVAFHVSSTNQKYKQGANGSCAIVKVV